MKINSEKTLTEDVDSPPLSEEILTRMKPVARVHPGIPPRVGVSPTASSKVPVSVRLSPQVVGYFKSMGKEWQARMDEVLCEYIKKSRS